MKNLIVAVAVLVSSVVSAQCFTSVTQSQRKLLNKYDIQYSSLQTRYIVSTNQIDKISDADTKKGMIDSYKNFIKWNNNQIEIIPDTNSIIETGADYLKYKQLDSQSELLYSLFNSSHEILQKIHIEIKQDNINSIEILEFHMTGKKDCVSICHMIFIEDVNGIWSNFSYDETDTSLDCPFCTVP